MVAWVGLRFLGSCDWFLSKGASPSIFILRTLPSATSCCTNSSLMKEEAIHKKKRVSSLFVFFDVSLGLCFILFRGVFNCDVPIVSLPPSWRFC